MTTSATRPALQGLASSTSSLPPRAPLGKKPILRTPQSRSVSTKRKRSDDSDDRPESSPTKRLKHVTFDLESNMTVDIGTRTLEETKREVRSALEDRVRGETEGYENLKAIFQNDRQRYLPPIVGDEEDCLKPQELIVYVVALSTCAPMLDRSCSDLIKIVTKCSWLGRDDAFCKAYTQFLAALISAQGTTLELVLAMIVEKFKDYRENAWSVPDFPKVSFDTAQDRLHGGLRYLLRLFPAARPVLCSLLAKQFPYLEESKRVHTTYVKNLLLLRKYAPDLGQDIMELIIDRLVKIDVQVQFDLDDMDDDLTAAIVMHLGSAREKTDLDIDSDESDAESIASDDSDFDAEATTIETGSTTIQKLDAIMDMLFEVYKPSFENPTSDEAKEVLGDLISDFVNLILPTYKSRHTQFLVFHFSQYSPELMDLFVGTLFNLAFESNRPMALRQSATAYLASYVARGAAVPAEIVRNVVELLCHHVDMQMRNHADGCRGPDLRRYKHLYCLVQALLYIFCFRWRELVAWAPDLVDPSEKSSYLGHDLEWIPGFKESMSRIIYSKFNPLRVCSPGIVHEFADHARLLRFMYVFPLLESNKRIHLSQFASGDYSTGGALRDTCYDPYDESGLQLEAYFPFDPYQLPTSKRWIQDDYVRWETLTGMGLGDDDLDDVSIDDNLDDDANDYEEEDTATDDGKDD
ncbi:hypothetical protein MCOR25_001614 [Pyricularia grisea]|uniref:RNA polymerase I-specific transcription initiation factor rrn3 n=1 Tax=Pyricularia grisea TaxID=148305 RepID=A0A6P8B9X2_PYRGI|nr:uncharacterized protein PgNI_03840 [Pyricularia grisea]KAI6380419.1 hypothetical protein MCOR25_001614 [Pyricularia grisea]TLD12611.1 hypothetical protein PgNI_03840 [Pyricularia grisea]